MSELIRQVGFCLVCGSGVYADQTFTETDQGYAHKKCLE